MYRPGEGPPLTGNAQAPALWAIIEEPNRPACCLSLFLLPAYQGGCTVNILLRHGRTDRMRGRTGTLQHLPDRGMRAVLARLALCALAAAGLLAAARPVRAQDDIVPPEINRLFDDIS